MRATILDKRSEGAATCYLCKISLEEYIEGLPQSYQDYDIQREIVSNVYLDKLVETVLANKHIPPIVLVISDQCKPEDKSTLNIKTFKILDGLQRTYRLQAIRKTIDFCIDNLDRNIDYSTWNKFKFSRTFSSQLNEISSSADVLRSIAKVYHTNGPKYLLKAFSDNHQWFEIWAGLSPEDEIRKMLTLNAGHKPVKTRHQLELLFLNLLPILKDDSNKDFELKREKEISSTQFSKGRRPGSFHFAHIITSLLSLFEAKPITPSTGLIQDLQEDDVDFEANSEITSPTFLKKFIGFLMKFDKQLYDQYGEIGTIWMGREVSLAGLFGAIGKIAADNNQPYDEVMDRLIDLTKSKPKILNLTQFEESRNSVDLSKVNIGNVNRNAIYSAIVDILDEIILLKVDWRKKFGPQR